MSASCQGYAALRSDPSGTKTLRGKYASKLRGKYADINTDIRKGVRDENVLGLGSDALATPNQNFQFYSDTRKVQKFRNWLADELENGPMEVVAGGENRYIRNAYERGMKDAQDELGANVSTSTLMGSKEKKLQRLYTRNFEALRGINDEVARQISETLTEGLADGIGPDEMARNLTDRVDKIGKTRATAMARTETLHAHTEAKLDTYQSQGVKEVVGQAEISTASDRRVCSDCQSHQGNRVSVQQARGYLPYHVNCRCVWMPVTWASQ